VDVFALTRKLVDVDSTTGNEAAVGELLVRELSALGYDAQKMPVERDRFNVYASPRGQARPAVVFSTHMDTVPPFFPSSETSGKIYGRGACDAKGIIAAQIAAAEKLKPDGIAAGLLFLVGEERDSAGARVANQHAPGSKFLVNGEPTENKLGIATKGSLRVEVTASGTMAHSAYPELGESAIEKLLTALERLRAIALPSDPELGATTVNIGILEGGRAPNVIADHARAHLLYRLVGPPDNLKQQILAAVGDLTRVDFVLEIPLVRLRALDGLPTMVAAFTTDIPALANWGQALLAGPGSIRVAHTEGEYVEKKQLTEAVDLYCVLAKRLLVA
jgi:acetylornithine deacetylase